MTVVLQCTCDFLLVMFMVLETFRRRESDFLMTKVPIFALL